MNLEGLMITKTDIMLGTLIAMSAITFYKVNNLPPPDLLLRVSLVEEYIKICQKEKQECQKDIERIKERIKYLEKNQSN